MAVIMLLSGFYAGTVVGTAEVASDGADSRSVRLLNALGIMGIDESTNMFWDESLVERREIAAILCSMLKLSQEAEPVARFTDVREEDRPCVETIAAYGYMNGVSADKFAPKEFVTREQLLKIFVSVLEMDEFAEEQGGYPNGYATIARKLKLTEGINGDLTGNATRIEVANIIYNALHIDLPTFSAVTGGKVVYEMQKGYTFLTENLKIYTETGVLNGNNATMQSEPNGLDDGFVMIGETLCKDPQNLCEDLLGHNVTAYVYRKDSDDTGEVVYIENDHHNRVLQIDSEDFAGVEDFTVSYYQSEKKKSVKLSDICNMIYNGKYVSYNPKYYEDIDGSLEFVDNNDDGKYDVAKIMNFDTFVIGKINEDDEKLLFDHNFGALELKDNFVRMYLNGERTTLDKLGVGMVVSVAVSEGEDKQKAIYIDAKSERIIGTVDRLFTDDDERYAVINEKEYKISEYCEKIIADNIIENIEAGIAGQYFTDTRGRIAYHVATKNNNSAGYLTRAVVVQEGFGISLKLKIFTAEGKIEEYATGEKVIIDGVERKIRDVENDYDLMSKLQNPQLVEYNIADGKIKKLDFAIDGYDSQKFSKDAPSASYEHYSSTLNHRYGVTAKTQVFKVPKANKNAANFMSIIENPSNFQISTGSYFSSGRGHHNVTLYDVGADGVVKYALIEYDPAVSTIRYTDPTMLVAGVNEGIDEEGNVCKVLAGYDENGNYIEVLNSPDRDAMYDATNGRDAKAGDIVQFNKDSNGRLAYAKIRKAVDSTEFTAIENVDWEYYMFISYGQAYKTSAEKIYLTTKELSGNITPVDTSMMVSDTGKAIYLFDSADKKIHKIGFNEIEYGDKVYACVNDRNYARMIVVYE